MEVASGSPVLQTVGVSGRLADRNDGEDWAGAAMSRADISHEGLSKLYDLWVEAANGDGLPDRRNFGPEILKPWLGNLVLIDVSETGKYRYRLYGSNFVFRFGVEMTNRTVDDLPPEQAKMIRMEYDAVVASKQPLVRRYTGGCDIVDIHRRLDSQRVETWERLVLPLSNGGDRVAMLLVAAYQLPHDFDAALSDVLRHK